MVDLEHLLAVITDDPISIFHDLFQVFLIQDRGTFYLYSLLSGGAVAEYIPVRDYESANIGYSASLEILGRDKSVYYQRISLFGVGRTDPVMTGAALRTFYFPDTSEFIATAGVIFNKNMRGRASVIRYWQCGNERSNNLITEARGFTVRVMTPQLKGVHGISISLCVLRLGDISCQVPDLT